MHTSAVLAVPSCAYPARSADKKLNVFAVMVMIFACFKIGSDHHGMMPGKSPKFDKLPAEGMLFTD
jgi:hypothetical protein